MFVQFLLWMASLLFLNRRDQCLRIMALQQQLEVYRRQQGGRRLQLTDQDRRFWAMLRVSGARGTAGACPYKGACQ